MRHHPLAAGAGLLAVLAGLGVPRAGQAQTSRSDPAASVRASKYRAEIKEGFSRVRAATAPFADLDSAVAAGYPREVKQCLADSRRGGMGFHHMNRTLLDTRLEVDRPEILLFERQGDQYLMNGVEYIVPYRVWPRDSVPPTIMGESLKRADELNLWYLHMWIWTENPAGLFADWNPKVQCPER